MKEELLIPFFENTNFKLWNLSLLFVKISVEYFNSLMEAVLQDFALNWKI
jgi:hypothetical protein